MQNKIKNILNTSFPDLTIRDGKPLSDIVIKPSAAINEAFEVEKLNFLQKAFLANYGQMTFEELDLLASNYLNTTRKLGRFSTGTVRIYLTQRTDIVFDKIRGSFADVRGRRFIPRFDFAVSVENLKFDDILGKYYIDIPVISEQPFGDEYLIGIGEINSYLGNNPFVEKVTNISQFVLVDTQESNTEFYNRITQNGVLLNNSRTNYFVNLILQTFPDIKKFNAIGAGNELMKRDLTFDSIDASIAIRQYNYYKKKVGSTIDNQNTLYKGLLDNINIDTLSDPSYLLSLSDFSEVNQDLYNAVSFKDKNSASISSLLIDDLFYLYTGFSDLNDQNWIITQNGGEWNKGSSAIQFTNSFDDGIKIKGAAITEPLLANNDNGLVMYKKIGDVKNTEFLLNFVIDDLETTVNQITSDGTSKKAKQIISNNNPLYFSVLKNGIEDKPLTFEGSTYDGYGVVIKKSDTNGKPNVFIVDGSTGTGKVAFEQEILQLGSDRILAAEYIPLSAGIQYTCLMQINEGYGLKVFIKGENNNELGSLVVGSGSTSADFTTTYSSNESFEEKEKSDTVAPSVVPRKFTFINTTDENLYASSFLDLAHTIAISNNLSLALTNGNRLIKIPDTSPAFRDFRKAIVGDIIEIRGLKFFITNIYDNYSIEVDSDLPTLADSGESWKIWRSCIFNLDYSTPNKAFYKNITLLTDGINKIIDETIANKTLIELKFLYINKLGEQVETILNWTNGVNMVAYEAQTDPAPVELTKTILFDKSLDSSLYFNTASNTSSYQSVYITQTGYTRIVSDYIRINTGTKTYLKKKDDFKQGYHLPLPDDTTNVTYITYVDSMRLKSSGYAFTKNVHYNTFNSKLTDILITPTYYNLFAGDVDIDVEVIGTSTLSNITTIGSSKGSNKLYLTTGSITDTDFFSVLINNERYFVKNINLAVSTGPYSDKRIEVTLDRNVGILSNVSIEIRKKTTITVNTNLLRYGYRYDIESDSSVWTSPITVKVGSKTLIKGEDYETDRGSKLLYYYISQDIISIAGFDSTDYLSFIFNYREILEERKGDGITTFKPLSTGTYLGIGFSSVNNGAWRIINVRSRKLLERYSNFIASMYIGDKPITNDDRLTIDLTTYSINVNTNSAPLNGSRILIYNYELSVWEYLYENITATSTDASTILQYYDGPNKEDRQFDFGYWDGSNFITINKTFYPTSYVNRAGYMSLLLSSRGKNEKDFTGNLLFGEAKLYLDYINITWQRKVGVHLGNKLDLLIATADTIRNTTSIISIPTTTNKISIPDSFLKPILKINYLRAENSEINLDFEMINNDKNLRFSTKEDIDIISANILAPGNYLINYDYLPGVSAKQDYINNLNHHIDVLVKNFVPVYIKLNIGYYGNIDETSVKNEIYNYIRFSSILDIDYIRALIETAGAVLTVNVNGNTFADVVEYDYLADPISKQINSYYSLKPEKYFDIKLTDISLVKIK